jgi:hypothetical protein
MFVHCLVWKVLKAGAFHISVSLRITGRFANRGLIPDWAVLHGAHTGSVALSPLI